MEAIAALTEILKSGGPYAMMAVAMVVAGYIYRDREALRKEAQKDQQNQNQQIIDMVTRLTEALTADNQLKTRLINLIEKWDDEIRRRN